MLSALIVPASADFGGGAGRSDFFTWTDGFGGGSFGGGAGREQSKAAYDAYVDTLPTPGYTSSGGLIWDTFSSFTGSGSYSYSRHQAYTGFKRLSEDSGSLPFTAPSVESSNTDFPHSYSLDVRNSAIEVSTVLSSGYFSPGIRTTLSDPVSGSYRRISSFSYSYRCVEADGTIVTKTDNYSVDSFRHFFAGDDFEVSSSVSARTASGSIGTFSYGSGILKLPVYEIIPDTAISGDTYNINTRPTSITGGNYGIVGDNGQIIKVEDNRTIVNETNSTFYNPATGQTVPITGWNFNYSDRSYKVTLQSGDIVTITYGDENITIKEGDTVYNIYYLIDGSGSGSGSGSGEHVHDWRESGLTPATCLSPGVKTYTCAGCQDTKPESIPALGHNWRILRTVTTQYDDEGLLVQEGYVLYECERCGEQYRTTDTSVKPNPGDPGNTGPGSGSGSGTDPGGEEDEGFLSWLFGKLGELLGTIGDGILKLLRTALEKIFGGLIDLVNSLFENLAKLVDLFGSVGEAFQVLWTWLPPEIIAILVAGVSIFVFVALLKFFMK